MTAASKVPPSPLVLLVDRGSAAALARALEDYRIRCRVNGGRPPPVLEQLQLLLSDRGGQGLPNVDEFEVAPDDGLMSLLNTYEDAGKALSVSQRTIRRLVQGGELRAVRIGAARRIHRDDLLSYAERLRQGEDHEHEED